MRIRSVSALVLVLPFLWSPAGAQPDRQRGVTLFEHVDLFGRSQAFYSDVADLSRTAFGQDSASSVRVDRGCRVTLYRDTEFRGGSVTLSEDATDLGRTPVGNDSVSSLRVECRGLFDYRQDEFAESVTLFADSGFRGEHETFTGDDPDLGTSIFGKDRASSIRVTRGCRATLYEHPGFQGRAAVLDHDVADLGDTPIGNDAVSSLKVDCRGGWTDDDGGFFGGDDPDEGVILYDRSGYTGRRETFVRDDPDLEDNPIGDNDADAVKVAPGCRVTLYENTHYRGRSATLESNSSDLDRTDLGRNQASSLQVDCGPRHLDDGRGHEDRGGISDDEWRERDRHGRSPDHDRGWDDGRDVDAREAVVLFSDVGFQGSSEVFSDSDASLEDNPIGNDRASSVRVAPGCEVILYEHANYQGNTAVLRQSEPDLRETRVGNDAVSSLEVHCRRRGWRH